MLSANGSSQWRTRRVRRLLALSRAQPRPTSHPLVKPATVRLACRPAWPRHHWGGADQGHRNVTGVAWFGFDILPKRIEFLMEMVPSLKRLAIISSVNGDEEGVKITEENLTRREQAWLCLAEF